MRQRLRPLVARASSRTAPLAALIVVLAGAIWAAPWLRHRLLAPDTVERRIDSAMDRLLTSGLRRFTAARLSEPIPWNAAPSAAQGRARVLDPTVRVAALTLQKVATTEPGALASRSLGLAYLVLGHTDKSIAALEDAIDLEPDDIGA